MTRAVSKAHVRKVALSNAPSLERFARGAECVVTEGASYMVTGTVVGGHEELSAEELGAYTGDDPQHVCTFEADSLASALNGRTYVVYELFRRYINAVEGEDYEAPLRVRVTVEYVPVSHAVGMVLLEATEHTR